MRILVLNAGSSSLKFAVHDLGGKEISAGRVTEIGASARIEVAGASTPCAAPDHAGAMRAVLGALGQQGLGLGALDAAAHRVVHGGARLVAPCRLDAATLAEIEACVPLAPLHNPANLTAIRAVAALAPDLPQFASFDTAFHATNPEVATRYAIPEAEAARGIRRYGFHGISYAALVARLPAQSGAPLPRRLLALHLGNGASICAIEDGRSVATTMGYSPLDGLTMGTRSGAIDPAAVLALAEVHGIAGAGRILNRESGLLALGGASDMRALHAADTPAARFAIAHFAYWAVRHAGSLIAAMGGLDAIAFTGGIGENDAELRARILAGLRFAGDVPHWVVPAAEEAQIAAEAFAVMRGES